MKKLYSFLLAVLVVLTASAQATIDFTKPRDGFTPTLPYVSGYNRPFVSHTVTYQYGPISLNFSEKGTQILGSSGPAQFAKDGKLTLTAPEGLGITKIVVNRPQGYQYTYNKFSIDGDEGVNTAASQSFTFGSAQSAATLKSMSSNWRVQNIQVWLEPKGEDPDPTPVTPDALYLLGTVQSSTWGAGIAGVKDGDVFTFEKVDLSAAEGSELAEFTFSGAESFATVTEHPAYAPAADKTPISAGQSADLEIVESVSARPNCFTIAADHFYTFSVNFGGEKPVVTVTDAGEKPKPVVVPETLYLLGSLEGNNWETGVAGVKDGDVFTFEHVDLAAAQGTETAEFTFSGAESIFLVSDYPSYAPAETAKAIAAGESAELTVFDAFTFMERPNYFTISPDHYYTLTIDFSGEAPVLKVADDGEKPKPVTKPEALYIYTIGENGTLSQAIAGTAKDESFIFSDLDLSGIDGTARVIFSTAQSASAIAASTAYGPANDDTALATDYSAQAMETFAGDSFGDLPNCYTIADTHYYTFTVDFTNVETPTVTVLTGDEKTPEVFEPLYLQGTFQRGAWQLNDPYEADKIERQGKYVVYTFTEVPMVAPKDEKYARFLFSTVKAETASATPDWSALASGYIWGADLEDEDATEVADGEFELVMNCIAPDTLGDRTPFSYNIKTGWTYTFKMYRAPVAGGSYVTIKPVVPVGVESLETETSSEARYYNLQGLPVATPAAGAVYIRLQDGKASKIRF